MFRFICAAALAVTLVSPTLAADYTAGSLKISQPWARATPKGAQVGGGYMSITNTGSAPDRLVGGSTGISSSFEIHEMSMDGGVMRMRMLKDGLVIKPGETVMLRPGGYHVMFMGLKQQLKQGETFKSTLQFEKAGKVDIEYKIESFAEVGPASNGSSGHGSTNMKH
ncbi:copper chaperone PCu(A)C [Pseudolabrys sp. FHR47]|uniref:copper chaperone PCu(A)C n=1 Tax=Pseudolabrys sp. FHR47 TaxID=2562284 RepID=UPI0010BE4586|nr:copper chaperone PCu(A)C [Pseudolabrys sp. FHR47]